MTKLQERNEDGEWVPLLGGRILFQAELAEVYFRDIKIKPLTTGPFRPQGSALVADADGVFQLLPQDAALQGRSLRFQPDEHNTLGHWHGLDDIASWSIDVAESGIYDFELEWSIDDAAAINTFLVSVGHARLEQKVQGTGGWWTYKKQVLGQLPLSAGTHQLTIKPIGDFKGALMDVRAIGLLPR